MTIIKIKKQITKKQIKITINNKDTGKPLKLKQIKNYATKLIDRYHIKSENDIYVRGLGNLGFTTLKSLQDNIDNMYNNDEEYFSDRVKEDTKFTEFYETQYVLFT